ncbi:MAG: hypothetical protein C5B53_12220 [Candidatus Melainabacteria bacterium]|nr:MAG: hypothetical protein C5B53_12220 [Candidatus Melainabacteria bacterium]
MNLDCAHHRECFSALIDQQLDSLNQGALEEHLCNCHDCSTRFADQKAIGQRLSDYFARTGESVPDLWNGLIDKLPAACELILTELSAFLDGELTSAAQEGVRVHLKDCQECLKQFRQLNTTNRLIVKALELPETRLDLWPNLKAQLNENCTLIKSELSAFIDQEMPMQRHRNITVHILECPTCSEAVRRFSGLGELITKAYLPQLSDNLNVLSGVRSHLKVVPFTPKEKPKAKAKLVYVLAALITVGLLVGAFALMAMIIGKESCQISAEAVLIQSDFKRPFDSAEAVVYGE